MTLRERNDMPLDDAAAEREIDAIIVRLAAGLDLLMPPGSRRAARALPPDDETAEREIDAIIARLERGISQATAALTMCCADHVRS